MHFSFSSGGKFRARSRRVSYSNRGGVRVRVGRGLSVGKSGVRYSGGRGPVRYSAGKSGVRLAVVGGVGPVYVGLNGSGAFVGVSVGTGKISKATTAAGQRKALASGMAVPVSRLVPQVRAECERAVRAHDKAQASSAKQAQARADWAAASTTHKVWTWIIGLAMLGGLVAAIATHDMPQAPPKAPHAASVPAPVEKSDAEIQRCTEANFRAGVTGEPMEIC